MRGNIRRDQNAGVVGSAALSVASLFFIAIMIIAFTANPIAIGTGVGQRAPDVEGKAYNGSSWYDFDDYATRKSCHIDDHLRSPARPICRIAVLNL